MNNPKHTKGPWHFIETGPIRKGGPKASLLANPSPHIHGVCEGVSDADARLISACPEMFEALEAICQSKILTGPKNVKLATLMIKALAKATGGAE